MKGELIDFSLDSRIQNAKDRISAAKKSVTIKCVFDWSPDGERIEAVKEALDRGVMVRIFYSGDLIHSGMTDKFNEIKDSYPDLFFLYLTDAHPNIHAWLIDDSEWYFEMCTDEDLSERYHGVNDQALPIVQKYLDGLIAT